MLRHSSGMTSWHQRPAALDLYREWSIFVDGEEFLFWPKIVENACNILKFIFVIRISASQNLLGLAITITSVFDDLLNVTSRYRQSKLLHNRLNIPQSPCCPVDPVC